MVEIVHFRVLFFGIFLAMLFISGGYRGRARSRSETLSRRSEGDLALLGRLLMVLPLLAAIFLYTFVPGWMEWASLDVPNWVRWCGVALGWVCLLLEIWVFRTIGENISETVLTKQEHRLVTTGPYRWVRHPLYATGMLLILSLALISASWLLAGFGFLALLIFRFVVIPTEERNLVAKFGSQYEAYMKNTGVLSPRFSR